MKAHGRFANFAVTFAAVFAIVYYFAVAHNWALFSYGPAVGQWTLFTQDASAGPTMYWYGWIATSALAAAGVAALVAFLPQRLTAIAAFVHLLSGYFRCRRRDHFLRQERLHGSERGAPRARWCRQQRPNRDRVLSAKAMI